MLVEHGLQTAITSDVLRHIIFIWLRCRARPEKEGPKWPQGERGSNGARLQCRRIRALKMISSVAVGHGR